MLRIRKFWGGQKVEKNLSFKRKIIPCGHIVVLSKSCANEHFHPLTFATRSCRADLCASKCEAAIWIKQMFKKHRVFFQFHTPSMANCVLSGDPAPAKTRYCTLVFWCFGLPDVSPLAAVGRFLEDFSIMRFCYLHVYTGFLALCTSCDLLNKSIFAAICYVSSVNGVLLVPLWLLFTTVLWKK